MGEPHHPLVAEVEEPHHLGVLVEVDGNLGPRFRYQVAVAVPVPGSVPFHSGPGRAGRGSVLGTVRQKPPSPVQEGQISS